MIDYAQHLIRIERLAKKASDLCLDKKYKAAQKPTQDMIVEARLLFHTLEDMQEREQVEKR
jgi:hypothetical protein